MKTRKTALLLMAFAIPSAAAARLQAQTPPGTASIQGHAGDELSVPVKDGEVKLTSELSVAAESRKYAYTFKTDNSGNYTGTGIAPGTYNIVLFRQGKSVDFISDPKDVIHALPQTFKAGETKTEDFDMSRPEFIAVLTPERKKEIEEFRAKNSATIDVNKVVAQLNVTLKTVRADLAAAVPNSGDVTSDVAMMKKATDAKPDESLLWTTYGDTLKAQGDHLAHDDAAQHKPVVSDDDAMKLYSSAVDAFKKAVELNAASKKPLPVDQAVAYNQMGNVLATQHKPTDAVSAFESAAKLDPTKAGMYYNNEAAILFNNNATQEAAVAADKAIAADPNRPDPYFVKGQATIVKATVVNGKLVAPPECVAAYQKYLELAPEGKFAPQVKQVLGELGQPVNSKYRAPGKK